MRPKLRTRRARAAEAAERWRRAMFKAGRPVRHDAPDVLVALQALGPRPDPDDVDRIIGNKTWTDPGECHGCGARPAIIVRVGEEEDFESQTADLCKACLQLALDLAERAEPLKL